MTRAALADRLVTYADAIAAFSVVNGITFLLAITEREVRCSLVDLTTMVSVAHLAFGAVLTAAVVFCRRVELRIRASLEAEDAEVHALLRGFQIVRIVVIWLSVLVTLSLAGMALNDASCVTPLQ